jgi:hypothetical protein
MLGITLRAACMFLRPWMTASRSPSLWRYGCSLTTVVRAGVMVMRPRETTPRPRYRLSVMASGRGGQSLDGL